MLDTACDFATFCGLLADRVWLAGGLLASLAPRRTSERQRHCETF
jgi:hypothetical protein